MLKRVCVLNSVVWLGLAILALGCSKKTPSPVPAKDYAIHYTVAVPWLPQDSLVISMDITDWADGDSVRLAAPPIYADNPFLAQTSGNFGHLIIRDTNNASVPYAVDSMQTGLYRSLVVSFAGSCLPVTIEYTVMFKYNTAALPRPHLGTTAGYLEGNYLFMIPCKNKSERITDLWRNPFDLYVHYRIGGSILWYGDPVPTAYFKNPYELLFSTSAVSNQLLVEGGVNGQAFRIIAVDSTAAFSTTLLTKVKNDFNVIVQDITGQFGTLENRPVTVILGTDPGGGFEGMYAFSVLDPWDQDSLGVFNMVLAHEMLHSWVGIRCGEYDDPWWKEGTTNYLGLLIAKRNGLCSQSLVEGTLLVAMADSNDVRSHTLSEDYVRNNLFATPNCITLVYFKGAQVCMLLDSRIREMTNGAMTFDRIVSQLVKVYDGRAFHRSDYLAFIKAQSGADVSDIFSQYVDQPGGIPQVVLEDAFQKLAARGAFGSISIAKRAATAVSIPFIMMKW